MEIVIGCRIFVVVSVSKLESAQDLDVRQASQLRIADAANPHRLSHQRSWRCASANDAGQASPELIDSMRRKDVGFRNRKIPVSEIAKGREPWDSGAGKWCTLIGVRPEEFRR
jgi:hypothetical protein